MNCPSDSTARLPQRWIRVIGVDAMRLPVALTLGLTLLALPALAQSANPLNPRGGNPLNPAAPTAPARAATTPAPQEAAPSQQAEENKPRRTRKARAESGDQATGSKPKREMSPAQKRNVEIMRSCGAEWREKRDTLKPRGETWRTFLASCRKRQAA
jgi:hypothetical protein